MADKRFNSLDTNSINIANPLLNPQFRRPWTGFIDFPQRAIFSGPVRDGRQLTALHQLYYEKGTLILWLSYTLCTLCIQRGGCERKQSNKYNAECSRYRWNEILYFLQENQNERSLWIPYWNWGLVPFHVIPFMKYFGTDAIYYVIHYFCSGI